jgi:hypothetical protein
MPPLSAHLAKEDDRGKRSDPGRYGGKKWENIFAVISNGKSSMFQYHF